MERRLLEDYYFEFPMVSPEVVGIKHRYAYLVKMLKEVPKSKQGSDNCYFDGFIKYDLEQERIVKEVNFGPTHTAGEVIFRPRQTGLSEKECLEKEDDGYLITTVHDWTTEKCELVVWDSKTLEEDDTPVLRAGLKQRVPNGFHSIFISDDNVEVINQD